MSSIPLRLIPLSPTINDNLTRLHCGIYSPTCKAASLPKFTIPPFMSPHSVTFSFLHTIYSILDLPFVTPCSCLISSCYNIGRHMFKHSPYRSTTCSASLSSRSSFCNHASYPPLFIGVLPTPLYSVLPTFVFSTCYPIVLFSHTCHISCHVI